jgi:hypothetical protein
MDPLAKALVEAAEDYTPPAASKVIDGDFRKRIYLPGQSGRLIDDFASDLAKHLNDKPIFNHGGNVAVVNPRNFTLQRISPSAFRSWVENLGGLVCQTFVGKGKDSRLEDMTMGEETAKAVLVSDRFIQGLREVTRVNSVRLPVRRASGVIELLPVGYDPESKILTIETVHYDEDMTGEQANDVFAKLMKDTAFDPKDKYRSMAAATAMILAPFCDCMLSRFDERPAFIVTANAEGGGKTTLIRMAICPVFGAMKVTPPPHIDSDKLTELLNSIAQSAAPYVVFDNWRGKVENAALEAFVTANQMGGRILGTSYTFDVEKQCLVFISGNQAIVGSDMRRRSMFVNLFVEEAKSEDRAVVEPINERIILSRRNDILAACWAYVRAWQDAKCPPSERRNLSFPEWGYMIGGILENMSYPCPLTPPPNDGDSMLQSFQALIAGVMDGVLGDEVFNTPRELLDVCRSVGSFNWKISETEPTADKDKRAESAALGRYCELYKGRMFTVRINDIDTKIKFEAIGQGHQRRYRFTKPTNEPLAVGPNE